MQTYVMQHYQVLTPIATGAHAADSLPDAAAIERRGYAASSTAAASHGTSAMFPKFRKDAVSVCSPGTGQIPRLKSSGRQAAGRLRCVIAPAAQSDVSIYFRRDPWQHFKKMRAHPSKYLFKYCIYDNLTVTLQRIWSVNIVMILISECQIRMPAGCFSIMTRGKTLKTYVDYR